MDDEYYLNLSPEFVERLGYIAGMQDYDSECPISYELCNDRRNAWFKGYKSGHRKRMEQNN
jgi:hypothetical protein